MRSIRQVLRLHGRTHRPGGSDPTGGIFFGAENQDSTQYPGLYIQTNETVDTHNVNDGDGDPIGASGNYGFSIMDNSDQGGIIGSTTEIQIDGETDVLLSQGTANTRVHLASGITTVELNQAGVSKFVVTDSTHSPIFEVDEDGTITPSGGGGSPTGAAGGALDGTYPNPGIASSVAGAGLAETSDVLSVNVDGSTIEINSDTLRLKDTAVTAATYGDATHVGQFTVNAKGQVTAASSVAITGTGLPTDGWNALTGLSYSSADAPTFVIATSSDLSGTIPVGARIKLTQTTVKYFIVTAIDSTTITVYGGGNTSSPSYTLANATITSPYWSPSKVPFGFPADPATWTYTVTDTTDAAQANPVSGTWYNLGTIKIDVPIGCWLLKFQTMLDTNKSAGSQLSATGSLSTSNNSDSDPTMDVIFFLATANTRFFLVLKNEKYLTLSSKTTHYLIAKVNETGHTSIDFRGDLSTTYIKAVCAYL